MDKKPIEETKKKLLEINAMISDLDPAIRSAAFDILVPLYFADADESRPRQRADKSRKSSGAAEPSDVLEKFFEEFTSEKPDDNVHLIAAWLYSQFGVFPITRKDVEDLATSIGLTIPERPDKTMGTAKYNKKSLYHKQNKGWQLTVHGEGYLKKTYNVKKGNKPRPSEDE